MMLSCSDLVAVITNHAGILLYLISWLREEPDLLSKMKVSLHISTVFLVFSLLALFVMNMERYIGAYYPIYHRTSVTRRRLITLLAILLIASAFMYIIIFLHKLQQLHIAWHSVWGVSLNGFRSGLSFKMDLNVYIQLIFLCVLNIIFTFSGIILNTLVIANF